jgi:hypothetical protein
MCRIEDLEEARQRAAQGMRNIYVRPENLVRNIGDGKNSLNALGYTTTSLVRAAQGSFPPAVSCGSLASRAKAHGRIVERKMNLKGNTHEAKLI